jgi:FkbO/Hyg5 family chorismatase
MISVTHDPAGVVGNILGVVNFTTAPGDPQARHGRLELDVHTASTVDLAIHEVWSVPNAVETHHGERVHYAHDGQVAFFAARLPEADRYAAAVRDLYSEIFALTRQTGYTEVFRMWNYVSGINGTNADGLETYRDFCVGRALAFEKAVHPPRMPAASGVGSHSGGVSVYLLGARDQRGVHIENPGQVPAYRYPATYGPKPPSFARATYLAPGTLFVSGTAAIIGHETVHGGDVEKQYEVALANIAGVMGERNLAAHGVTERFTMADLKHVKVYVRHEEDLAVVRAAREQDFAADAQVVYITTDICRGDLLVEIEGVAHAR